MPIHTVSGALWLSRLAYLPSLLWNILLRSSRTLGRDTPQPVPPEDIQTSEDVRPPEDTQTKNTTIHKPVPITISKKRLFICCDGTGRDSIRQRNDYVTNVARFARCIKNTAEDGTRQLVYYREGVAMHLGDLHFREAATGQGIHGMIQDAYYFICLNYHPGDEIHLVGFSRGAFTVRALACFIETVGILAKTRVALLPMIYSLWRDQNLEKLQVHIKTWEEKGHLSRDVEIMTCGVWDTVSAMIPARDLAFVSYRVPRNLLNAFQALALHEMRTPFPPVLWNTDDTTETNVIQVWFAGDHSDIGGGHPDAGLSTISLLWMVAQYHEFTDVDFEELMLLDCMTPLYLHWQDESTFDWGERSFIRKAEYALESNVYTKGNVHGPESWSTHLWYLPGQASLMSREAFFQTRTLTDIIPRLPLNRAERPTANLNMSLLNDTSRKPSLAVPPIDEGYTSDADARSVRRRESLAAPPPSNQSWPRIHFTVRILMSARKQECYLLQRFSHTRVGKLVAWTDVTDTRGLFEDPVTKWESWMFRQWIKREEDMFGNEPSPAEDRFTRFLHPFRHEGERPRKAFYSHAPRASSADRSGRIKDANDMVAEGLEKGSDLTQSRASAATSVESGVKYYLDLDFEGYLPERFGRVGGNAAWREFQLRGRGRPDMRRKIT